MRIFAAIHTILLLLVLCSCQMSSERKFQTPDSLISQEVVGKPFKHIVFTTDAQRHSNQNNHYIVILIDGDGVPVTNSGSVARDPTPKESFLLSPLKHIPAKAYYLGRPCYFRLKDENCHPKFWTLSRYSTDIIESLSNAIDRINPGNNKVVLVGYSGGATLSYGIAKTNKNVVGLITLAGNMAVKKWNHYHSYSPMPDAIDPLEMAPLSCDVKQIHLFGKEDENILPLWATLFSEKESINSCYNVEVQQLKDVGHREGWQNWWNKINWNEIKLKTGPAQKTNPVS